MTSPVIHRSHFADLEARDLYDILQLRSAVFVVEQDCVFLDLDGRDHEPDAVHLWVRDDGGPAAAARVLDPGTEQSSIGRIVTRTDARAAGVASALINEAISVLEGLGSPRIHLGAQAHLAGWYQRFGFHVSGDEYDEDGIPHVPMVRHADPSSSRSAGGR